MAFRNKPVLALIPARGGSKGVPRKNLRVVRGKPLIAHTADAALAAAHIDKVYLSSDDDEILAAGRALGVDALKRPDAAASDTATANQVVLHFIGLLPDDLLDADPFLAYLQPTSPLRTAAHIDGAFGEMEAKGASACLSVTALKKTPYKCFVLDQGLLQSLFSEELSNANRESLPAAYYPNGAIYIFQLSEFIRKGGFPSNGGVPFIMSETESIDIDTEDDIAMIERL